MDVKPRYTVRLLKQELKEGNGNQTALTYVQHVLLTDR